MATQSAKPTADQRGFASCTVSTAATGLSDVIDCGGLTLTAIKMPSAWTAASLTFLGSFDSTATMANLFTSTGGEVTVVASTAQMMTFDPYQFAGIRFVQLRSGTAGAAVAQGAARTVQLGLAPFAPIK